MITFQLLCVLIIHTCMHCIFVNVKQKSAQPQNILILRPGFFSLKK